MAKKPTRKELDALDRAQELVYDAWEADSVEQRTALAKKALAVSPLCADAWCILAQHADTEQEIELWSRAVDAGATALGDAFDEYAGEFWGWMETRPYMRARQGLAGSLWAAGRRDEAMDQLRDMLRLNPNDNQGVRYSLIGYLVETDRHEDISALKVAYPEEDMAMWTWPIALAAFRRTGDTPESREALRQAIESNPHVPKYLTGERKMPKQQPQYYGAGDQDEAVLYVAEFGLSWVDTPNVLEWLRTHTTGKRPAQSNRKGRT